MFSLDSAPNVCISVLGRIGNIRLKIIEPVEKKKAIHNFGLELKSPGTLELVAALLLVIFETSLDSTHDGKSYNRVDFLILQLGFKLPQKVHNFVVGIGQFRLGNISHLEIFCVLFFLNNRLIDVFDLLDEL